MHFFSHEFPQQLRAFRPEALAFGGLTTHHLTEIGMAVVERNPMKAVAGAANFMASKYAYMALENRHLIKQGIDVLKTAEGRESTKQLASIFKKDLGLYYQGYPSLSKNWAETGNLNPSKYIQDVTTDVLTMYQKAGILKEVAENPANVFKYLKNEDIPKDLAGLGMQTADIVKRDLQHGANNIVKTGKPLVGSTDILQDAIDQSLLFLTKPAT
jgi:hypothetical protein